MLFPAPMLRLSAVVLERDRRRVLLGLGGLGAVQLTHGRTTAGAALPDPPDLGEALAACDARDARVVELLRSLGVRALPEPSAEAGDAPDPDEIGRAHV